VRLELCLSKPSGTVSSATVRATITRVKYGDIKSWFTKKLPAARVGDTRTLTLRKDVILEPFTDELERD
jgi:hypothetical protein